MAQRILYSGAENFTTTFSVTPYECPVNLREEETMKELEEKSLTDEVMDIVNEHKDKALIEIIDAVAKDLKERLVK